MSTKDKVDSEIKRRIRSFVRGRPINRISQTTDREFEQIERRHKGIWNRVAYVFGILLILAIIAHYGGYFAESHLPPEIFQDHFVEFGNFRVDYHIKNIHHDGDRLTIETEWLEYTIIIKNKLDFDAVFKVNYRVSNSAEQMFSNTAGVDIKSKQTEPLKLRVPFKKAGINTVTFAFEMYKSKEGDYEGQIDYSAGTIEEKSFSIEHRVFSLSDYNYQVERAYLFKYLWVAAAPLVIIGVKHFRDIIESR